jgi:hypothetical protein
LHCRKQSRIALFVDCQISVSACASFYVPLEEAARIMGVS